MKRNLLLLFLLLPLSAFAQDELSASEIEEFKERAKVKVKHFQDYLSILGSKNKKADVKRHYKEETLKLFVGDGKEVTMEVSIIDRGQESRKRHPITNYLDNLIKLPYAKVEITFANTWYISNFYKTAEGRYEATATLFQEFRGRTTEGNLHASKTKKTIQIYIEMVEDDFGKRWVVRLGDVSVAQSSAS